MPLFFFVGGFSNLASYRSARARGDTVVDWLRDRLARLLKPSLVFLAVWAVIQAVLFATHAGTQTAAFLRGVRPLGLGRGSAAAPIWWLERPLWLVLPAIVLAGLVSLLGRFERPRARPDVRTY